MIASVVLVHLRQPRDANDARDDPFWEYGSFGCTGCHAAMVSSGRLDGVRLGFTQGGADAHRLVWLTPPVHTVLGSRGAMVTWQPADMPFRFERAPLLIDRFGDTDFPLLRQEIATVNRDTWLGRFSSKFRSRTQPLTLAQSVEVITVFEQARTQAGPPNLALHYFDAIPPDPMDRRPDRLDRYHQQLEKVGLRDDWVTRP